MDDRLNEMIDFEILKKSKKSRARLGLIKTEHGVIETPSLVPVATQAVVKTLDNQEVSQTKSQILISNTFHLHLRPGEKNIKLNGGIHKFMNWTKPIMTDSGGFQVFSLGFGKDLGIGKIIKRPQPANSSKSANVKIGQQPKEIKITESGVYFRSYIDGSKLFLGPKESIKIQGEIGADIIFAFDECPPPTADFNYNKESMERTHRWALKSLEAFRNQGLKSKSQNRQALYGIVQGGKFKELRKESAKFIGSLPFDGFGIGGEFGDDKKSMIKMIDWVIEELPENKPRHLLGIGYLEDIEKIIKSGVDTFDCTVPTHFARHGQAFIHAPEQSSVRDFASGSASQKLDISKAIFAKDRKPLDLKCDCTVCQNYTRSYVHHLYRAHEITALKLLTFHNLYFFNSFVENIRRKIKKGLL